MTAWCRPCIDKDDEIETLNAEIAALKARLEPSGEFAEMLNDLECHAHGEGVQDQADETGDDELREKYTAEVKRLSRKLLDYDAAQRAKITDLEVLLKQAQDDAHISRVIVREHAEYESLFCDRHIDETHEGCLPCKIADLQAALERERRAFDFLFSVVSAGSRDGYRETLAEAAAIRDGADDDISPSGVPWSERATPRPPKHKRPPPMADGKEG